ncbi:hypothetical protein PV328_007700 [Microctonus aethiopoides]|uniref:Uncharacterized protein n=1 Tax=Microctonus aethiopoides TaxID=144406 RepID=A0AA39C9R2_9HYME|nr:hypothetical protein PV328_007700 [Microctonus aethiopoides]
MEATSSDEIDIQALLKGIDERNMEADNVLASGLSFVREQGDVSNYTIPRLNPRYGRKRGDWMMESQSNPPPPARRGKQVIPRPRIVPKPKVVASQPIKRPVNIKTRPCTRPESTPQAKAMAVAIKRTEPAPRVKRPAVACPSAPPNTSINQVLPKIPLPTITTQASSSKPSSTRTIPGPHVATVVSQALQGAMKKIAAVEAMRAAAKGKNPTATREPIRIKVVPSRPPAVAVAQVPPPPETGKRKRKRKSGNHKRRSFFHKEGETMMKMIRRPDGYECREILGPPKDRQP